MINLNTYNFGNHIEIDHFHQVDRMAVFDLKPVLADIAVCCQVRNIYIRDFAEPGLLQKLSAFTNVKKIPREEWNKKILK